MSVALASVLLLTGAGLAQAEAPAVPLNVLFAFYKARAFHDRADTVGCDARGGSPRQAVDTSYEALRHGLIVRYGATSFEPKPAPAVREAGDCSVILIGYQHAVAEAADIAVKE